MFIRCASFASAFAKASADKKASEHKGKEGQESKRDKKVLGLTKCRIFANVS